MNNTEFHLGDTVMVKPQQILEALCIGKSLTDKTLIGLVHAMLLAGKTTEVVANLGGERYLLKGVGPAVPGVAFELEKRFLEKEFSDVVMEKKLWERLGSEPVAAMPMVVETLTMEDIRVDLNK